MMFSLLSPPGALIVMMRYYYPSAAEIIQRSFKDQTEITQRTLTSLTERTHVPRRATAIFHFDKILKALQIPALSANMQNSHISQID